jgi:hypothetical protein
MKASAIFTLGTAFTVITGDNASVAVLAEHPRASDKDVYAKV